MMEGMRKNQQSYLASLNFLFFCNEKCEYFFEIQ